MRTLLGRRLLVASSVAAMTVVATACSHHGAGALPAVQHTYSGPLAQSTISFAIPIENAASNKRPAYVSSATRSVVFTLNSASELSAGDVTNYNASEPNTFNTGTLPSAACPVNGTDYLCTFSVEIPPGSDNVTLAAYDATGGTGHLLSGQTQTITAVGGQNNTFPFVLDASAATMTVTPQTAYCAAAGALAGSATETIAGTSPVTFAVTYTDPAGKTIVGPGLPTLQINGSSTSGTITGTGGNVAFAIDQSAQTYTLAATTTATTANISVSAVPGNSAGGSDGLNFTRTLAYTLKSTASEPSSFLAEAEQNYSITDVQGTGVLDLWTVTLGASDSITPYSIAQLPVQNADVYNPNGMVFDASGDLLLANTGLNPNDGNFACIPAPQFGGGSASPTVITTNANNPISVAFGADGSAAVINANAAYLLSAFTLGTAGYSPASATHNIAGSGYPHGYTRQDVIALPASAAYPAGSYAVAIGDDDLNAVSHVVIKKPDGSTAQLPTDASVISPSLGYDAANNQLIVSDRDPAFYDSHMTFWNLATLTKVTDFIIEDDPSIPGSSAVGGSAVAASADGHVAAIIEGQYGDSEVVVYGNTAARTRVANAIDYYATNSDASFYYYGGSSIDDVFPTFVRWLSNTKLLVGLESENGNQATPYNGLYIYDITQTMTQPGYDQSGAPLPSPTYKQTYFRATPYLPYAAAYRP